jgi:outer membrane lipoprotein-sorting protein
MRITQAILTIVVVLSPLITSASTGSVAQAEAQLLMGMLDQHFQSIQSLSYTAERTTQGRRQSSKERWRFAYQAPGLVRVDYQYPVERHLILTTNTLTEYIPALHRALVTDLGKLSESARQTMIRRSLTRVSLDGINPAKFNEMAIRTTTFDSDAKSPDQVRIIGAAPKFAIELDSKRKVIQKTDIYTSEDSLLLHTEASDFIEAGPGFWYPRQVTARYLTNQRFADTSTVIRDISINTPLTNVLFQFTPPPHVSVETR